MLMAKQYFVLVCVTLGSKTWSCGYSQIYHVKWWRHYGKIGEYCIHTNPFQANVPILYPLKTPEGYKMGTLA